MNLLLLLMLPLLLFGAQVGMGAGEWTPDKVNGPDYNLDNPHMRDTATLLLNGTTEDRAAWVAFRCDLNLWPCTTGRLLYRTNSIQPDQAHEPAHGATAHNPTMLSNSVLALQVLGRQPGCLANALPYSLVSCCVSCGV